MNLIDLVGAGGEGVTRNGLPVPRREGVGLICRCPCGCADELYVPFLNPLDGGPPLEERYGWQRTGSHFELMTLSPSIHRRGERSCGWHGFITDGKVLTI